MASIFVPTNFTAALGPYSIDANDCIGDSVGIINANTNYLAAGILSVSAVNVTQNTNITDLYSRVTGANSVLQISTSATAVPPTIENASTITDTGLGAITITRKSTTSNILIDVTGGRYRVDSGQSLYTYFFVSENGGSYNNLTNATTPIEFIDSYTGTITGVHSLRYIYKPINTVTTATLKVYYKGSNSAQVWNLNDATATVPITISLTEIAT